MAATVQIARGIVRSPSTMIHLATVTHKGNAVTGVTDCGHPVDVRKWDWIPSRCAAGETKCKECFR